MYYLKITFLKIFFHRVKINKKANKLSLKNFNKIKK